MNIFSGNVFIFLAITHTVSDGLLKIQNKKMLCYHVYTVVLGTENVILLQIRWFDKNFRKILI